MRKFILAACLLVIALHSGFAQDYFGNPSASVFNFCFNGNGELLAVPAGNRIDVWNIRQHEIVTTLPEVHTKPILAIDYSKSGKYIVSGGEDSTLIVWNVVSRQPSRKMKVHEGMILCAKFSPDDSLIVSGSSGNDLVISSTFSGKTLHILKGHKGDVTDIKFLDTNIIASCSADGCIFLWNTATGAEINHWQAHHNWIRELSVNPGKTLMLSCSDDGTLKAWDIADLKQIKLKWQQKVSKNWLTTVDLLDGNAFACSGHDRKVSIIYSYGKYTSRAETYVTKVRFVVGTEKLQLIIATLGRGIYQIDAKDMKYSE